MIESFKIPNITPETLTGSIVSFNDEYGGLPLKSCTSLISGYQEGSGTPSPSNVRNLVSFNSATLTENGNTHLFTFGQSIYHGSIDWEKGVVTADFKIANLSDYTWELIDSQTSGYDYGYFRISGNIEDMDSIVGLECEIFKNGVNSRQNLSDNELGRYNSSSFNRRLCVRCDSCTTINDFNNLISDKKIAYRLATPIEIPIGGINLLTQEGQNNFFCDTGDTTLEWLKVN